jgi:Trk K+ transport system NAD-binding subunit
MNWSSKKIINLLNWALFVVCISSAFIGFSSYSGEGGEKLNFWSRAYFTMQLFVLEFNIPHNKVPGLVNFARFLAPVVLTSAVLSFIFFNLKNYFNILYIRLFYHNHAVFSGLGTKTYLLAQDFANKGNQVLIIEKDPGNYYLNLLKHKNIRFITGKTESEDLLLKAKIHKASFFYALTESDSANINLSHLVNKSLKDKNISKSIKINLHLSELNNLQIFKSYQEKSDDLIDIHAFNIYQKAAALVAYQYSPDQFLPILTESDTAVHVLVHGMNPVGQALIIEIAQLYHFTNLKKTKLTVVDDFIQEKADKFLRIFPFIEQVLDIEFVDSFELKNDNFYNKNKEISVCFVCSDTDSQSINIAKTYRQEFVNLQVINTSVTLLKKIAAGNLMEFPKIVVVLPKDPDFLNLFSNIWDETRLLNIDLFEIYPQVCTKTILTDDMEIYDDLAMQIHNTYLNLESAELIEKWNELTDEQKDWNRYPARHLFVKLRYLGAAIEELSSTANEFDFSSVTQSQNDLLARVEHTRWVAEKLIARFRPTVETSNKEVQKVLKTKLHLHKDIRPWEELSLSDHSKDSMFIDDLQRIATRLNKKIVVK